MGDQTVARIEAQDYRKLTQPERAQLRGRYVEQQNGDCHHCAAPLTTEPPASITRKSIDWRRFPRGFLKHPVHLHHCHRTGKTIGAVHAYCNAVLWQCHGE